MAKKKKNESYSSKWLRKVREYHNRNRRAAGLKTKNATKRTGRKKK